MIKDTMQVETIGGSKTAPESKQRTLRWNLATLKYIGQMSKDEPFNFSITWSSLVDLFKIAYILTYSGLMSDYEYRDETPDFTEKDVERWVGAWDSKMSIEVIKSFSAKMNDLGGVVDQASGEEATDTQSEKAA